MIQGMTRQAFLEEIEAFMERHGVSAWWFSKNAADDTSFVYKLRGGKGVTLGKVEQVQKFMREYEKDHASV